MRLRHAWTLPVLFGLVFAVMVTAGCGGDGDDPFVPPPPPPEDHTQIVLRDYAGAPIARGSTVPYSPKATCGECHPYDAIVNGYHFQQGRTDAFGTEQTAPGFGGAPFYILSDGMYGKW